MAVLWPLQERINRKSLPHKRLCKAFSFIALQTCTEFKRKRDIDAEHREDCAL